MNRGLLTVEVATQAFELILPAIRNAMGTAIFKRDHLHVVVSNPTFTPGSLNRESWAKVGILYEQSIGDQADWEYPYDRIARSKSYLSWKYQLPSQIIQLRCPHLLEDSETLFYGSAVADGLVVGVSGVQPYFDQMVAGWMLEACRALCIKNAEYLRAEKNNWV